MFLFKVLSKTNIKGIIIAVSSICCTASIAVAQPEKKPEEVCYNPNAKGDTSKRSIKSAAVGTVGGANIKIDYYSPGVRKRTIWGGLVPYDEVWVTGAHQATSIDVDKSFVIEGKTIPPGKYALFTIPGKTLWTVIINKNWQQHLADDYHAKDDVIRVHVEPVNQDKSTERLQYSIKSDKNNKGTITIAWEKLKIEFPLMTKTSTK